MMITSHQGDFSPSHMASVAMLLSEISRPSGIKRKWNQELHFFVTWVVHYISVENDGLRSYWKLTGDISVEGVAWVISKCN